MNIGELVEQVSDKTGMDKTGVKKVVDATFTAIIEAAKASEDVALPGFGQFKVKDVPARQGRNPATGEAMEIAATRKLSFTPAKAIKDALKP
jgi:DNA-binding protein HU-beta